MILIFALFSVRKMIRKVERVHVFSIIPYLSAVLQKRLPNISVINVLNKNNDPVSKEWNKKVVSNDELLGISDAEIVLGDENLIAQVYQNLDYVKFIQCTWAGVEILTQRIKKERIVPKYPISKLGSQIFSQYMAEYVVGQILMRERNWIACHNYQVQKIWAHQYEVGSYRSLQEITVGVLGVGSIGNEVIHALKFFKSRVFGFGRSKSPSSNIILDKYFTSTELPSLLEECDYIVNVLPSTPATRGILGNNVLSCTKKSPILMNIGRGDAISEDDIIIALNNSWISSAILDVIITPHVGVCSKTEDIVSCFLENLERYNNGDSLKNVINWEEGY
ncbi:Glyoxylate/hydroxypyruvate reductase A [Armadillidium vulgare]|nr:Glyoxylate/hydroxypyruvate reductase A [Armadillidium vulgare]